MPQGLTHDGTHPPDHVDAPSILIEDTTDPYRHGVTMSDTTAELQRLLPTAEAALSHTCGSAVRLGDPDVQREQYRNLVVRCPVAEGPVGMASSVIVKASVGDG